MGCLLKGSSFGVRQEDDPCYFSAIILVSIVWDSFLFGVRFLVGFLFLAFSEVVSSLGFFLNQLDLTIILELYRSRAPCSLDLNNGPSPFLAFSSFR